MDSIAQYVTAGAVIAGLIWGIVKVIARLTPTKKDDEFVDKVDPVVNSTVEALEGGSKAASKPASK